MFHTDSLHDFVRYSDWANGRLLEAVSSFSDAQLDQPFDIGLGSLRRTLTHICIGEHMWLQRWQGRTETRWPNETEKEPIAALAAKFRGVRAERDAFLAALSPSSLAMEITYRDSKGKLYTATLSDMLIQGVVHSIHHRAQAANMIRRAGGELVDLDYMYWVRKPASLE